MSSTADSSTADPTSTAAQDANWPAPKLMAIGAVSLAFALALIYTMASVLGE